MNQSNLRPFNLSPEAAAPIEAELYRIDYPISARIVHSRRAETEFLTNLIKVLKGWDDTPELFPKGKWATIQHIEDQL